jgi:hypothetical protein
VGLVYLVSLMLGRVDPITLLTLVLAMYLTLVELREFRPQPHWKWWMWWLSLVFLTHFIGYLILRGYAAYRRSHEARA